MKVDLIKKYKWYILGLIIAWILMAVGLSFCAWDDNSIKKSSINGVAGDYYKIYDIVDDEDENGVADVGDIVTYGSYYQTSEATGKDPIRWIVVHKANDELTLLAESILAFGNFWDRYYHNGSVWILEDISFNQYYQNYMKSTLSMWLNSDYGSRHDKGVAFTANNSKLGMRGFMNEAFTTDEIKHINSRTISGIQGMAPGNANTALSDYGSKEYKVWVPSWSEIFGTATYESNVVKDGNPNTQFEYFKGVAHGGANHKLVGKTTAFASTPYKSNYTTSAGTSHVVNAQNLSTGGAAWWWLRSPDPSYAYHVLVVLSSGLGGTNPTGNSNGGVRPAICIPV